MTRDSFASNQFLREDGSLPPSPTAAMLHDWLPERDQAINALQLQFEPFAEEEAIDEYAPDSVWFTSMRQGLGLIVLTGLVAGFLPFLVNWFLAARVGVVVPLSDIVRGAASANMSETFGQGLLGSGWLALETAAGMPPAVFPGWLAAGLSALGLWINWPLNLLAIWLVYGAGIAMVAHWLGSPVTLQRFYALTSYAVLPLALMGLGIIPCIGFLVSLFAAIYAFAVYIFGVRAATGLTPGRAIVATIAPLAILGAAGSILAFSSGAFIAGIIALLLGS
ncbi:MAG: hypothetical protein WDZ49_13335 [Litorilinea sp.]